MSGVNDDNSVWYKTQVWTLTCIKAHASASLIIFYNFNNMQCFWLIKVGRAWVRERSRTPLLKSTLCLWLKSCKELEQGCCVLLSLYYFKLQLYLHGPFYYYIYIDTYASFLLCIKIIQLLEESDPIWSSLLGSNLCVVQLQGDSSKRFCY